MKYRKLPVEIEAIQWNGENNIEIKNFLGDCFRSYYYDGINNEIPYKLEFITLEGKMMASLNDYIIKGVKGEFYPCKPDIFLKTYEKVED